MKSGSSSFLDSASGRPQTHPESRKESEKAGADTSGEPPLPLPLHLPQVQTPLRPQTDLRRKSTSAQGSSMAAKGSGYPGFICTCGPQMVARDHDTKVTAHRVLSHDPLCLPLETQHELTKI